MKTMHTIGLGLGAGALALGGVAGFAQVAQADPTAAPTPSASAGAETGRPAGTDRPGGKGHHGDRDGQGAAKLAEKLGVDQAKVEQALRTAREALRPSKDASGGTTESTREQRDAALAAELAKALGIDQAQVSEALTALEAEQDAARAAALTTRLDQAVTDGKLTRAEADAVKKAVEAGVIGGGGHR